MTISQRLTRAEKALHISQAITWYDIVEAAHRLQAGQGSEEDKRLVTDTVEQARTHTIGEKSNG
jgi:hypothetical protein